MKKMPKGTVKKVLQVMAVLGLYEFFASPAIAKGINTIKAKGAK